MYTFQEFNKITKDQAATELFKCCDSSNWVDQMMAFFPFESEEVLFEKARIIWYEQCKEKDYLEAFAHHPKIGDVDSLSKKFASTQQWAGKEQAGVQEATAITIQELARLNEVYFDKFGFIFIVFATGKSAAEMLKLLSARVTHSKEEEVRIARGEQFKITLLRLQKLIQLEAPFWNSVSQITTHVLNTSIGKPGKGIKIALKAFHQQSWQTIAIGITNEDGRIANLLPANINLVPGNYQMSFDTLTYFEEQQVKGFYPEVNIHFTTFDQSHYHVPLLINPFGYSTYRGS